MVVDHLLDMSIVVVVPSSTFHDAPPSSRRAKANAVGNRKRNEKCNSGLTELDRRLRCPRLLARLGDPVDGDVEEGIRPAYSGKIFPDEMSAKRKHQRPPALHVYAEGNGASSPCTHVVVPRRQRQIDAPESVERESWACVELVEDPGEMGGGRYEFSASAWHGVCPSSLSSTQYF